MIYVITSIEMISKPEVLIECIWIEVAIATDKFLHCFIGHQSQMLITLVSFLVLQSS